MTAAERTVAIVGAGPVGLMLALCAVQRGLEPVVIERHSGPRAGSRSIGVHPPALEILDGLGLAEEFLARGVLVRRGLAFGASGQLGAVSFEHLPGRHRWVLSIPQEDTERILAAALAERAPRALMWGTEVAGLRQGDGVVLELREAGGTARTLRAAAAVGCDGKHSTVRAARGIAVDGTNYDGLYAMADFPDTTPFGSDAAVFLTGAGLVESFPLPGGMRRWVIRRDGEPAAAATVQEIVETVRRRTGQRLAAGEVQMATGFQTEHRLARRFSAGAVALAGDAAHLVSPIGGQGMNLGWLGAASLARTLAGALERGQDPASALAADGVRRRRVAQAATRRAELNMWLGRATAHPERRDRVVRTLLRQPSQALLARLFTMRHLHLGV